MAESLKIDLKRPFEVDPSEYRLRTNGFLIETGTFIIWMKEMVPPFCCFTEILPGRMFTEM